MNSTYSSMMLIVLMILFMYFFMMRPQQKQRKAHQDMVSSLQPGDEVVTIGRLHGTVHEVNTTQQTVTLDCEGIYLTFDLNAIMRVNRAQAVAEPTTKEAVAKETETDK